MSTEQNTNKESKVSKSSKKEEEISIADILQLIWSNRYWFILSVFLCIGVAFFYLQSSSKIYSRKATVLIRDDSKGGGLSESSAFADLGLFGGKRNVDNELLIFQSRHLMEEVARRLHLDISYKIKEGLRNKELYTHSPVVLSFPEAEERQSILVTVTPIDSTKVELSNLQMSVGDGEINSNEILEVNLNDTVQTPVGVMVVMPTLYYSDSFYSKPISVTKSNMERIVDIYQNSMEVSLASKTATIINLTLKDVSVARAEDVINMAIAIYNEDAINDKNQIAVNTSNFINDRLIIIERELGGVDSKHRSI